MGCGCSQDAATSAVENKQQETKKEETSTKITEKKKKEEKQSKKDVAPPDDGDGNMKKKRKPAPKESLHKNPLLKSLPWNSIRKAMDSVLEILDSTSKKSVVSFKESLSILTKFRNESGLFYNSMIITTKGDHFNQEDEEASNWKGRGMFATTASPSFVDDSEVFSVLMSGDAKYLEKLSQRSADSLGLDAEDILTVISHLSEHFDVVLSSLFKEVSETQTQNLSLFSNDRSSSATEPKDFTKCGSQLLLNVIGTTLKSSFSKIKSEIDAVASSSTTQSTSTATVASFAADKISSPMPPGPMSSSAQQIIESIPTNASSGSWNFILQSLETVIQISRIFGGVGHLSPPKLVATTGSKYLSFFLTNLIYRFTGDPSLGMCSVMKLEEILGDLKSVLACLGILPSSMMYSSFAGGGGNNNNNSDAETFKNDFFYSSSSSSSNSYITAESCSWFTSLPITLLLAPDAVSCLLYCGCILNKQQRLTLKGLKRDPKELILEQLGEQLGELSESKHTKNFLYATSFRLSPNFFNEAGEGHGPRKDFFSSCCEALLQKCFQISEGRTTVWFNPMLSEDGAAAKSNNKGIMDSFLTQPSLFSQFYQHSDSKKLLLREHFLAGWLMGSGIVNGVTLVELGLPSVFFHILKKVISTSNNKLELLPIDVAPEDLLEVSEDLAATIQSVKKMKNNVDKLIQFCESCIIDNEETDQDDLSMKTIDDALNSSDPCSLKTTIRLLKSCNIINSNNNCEATPSQFVLLRHVVYPTLFEDSQLRWKALAQGFKASTVPYALQSSVTLFDKLITRHQLHSCCTGGSASIDSINKNFSFQKSFNFYFDKEFSKNRLYHAFKNVVVAALEQRENISKSSEDGGEKEDEEESELSAEVAISNLTPASIEFKRKILQFITGRKLLTAAQSSAATMRTSSLQHHHQKDSNITVALISSQSTGWQVKDIIYQLSKKLPTAHTCTNTLEVPNYMEAACFERLMQLQSSAFAINPTTKVDDALREKLWDLLNTEEERMKVRIKAHGMLLKMLKTAAYEGLTFELDEVESTGDRNRHFRLA